MKKRLFGLMMAATVIAALTYQNCGGSRSRTGDLNVSLSEVEAELTAFQAAAAADPSGASAKAQIDAFIAMHSSPTSTLYYSVAPSSLGSIAQALPIDFATFDSQNTIGTPSKVIAFVVVDQDASGWRGAMIITGNSSGGTAATTNTTGAKTMFHWAATSTANTSKTLALDATSTSSTTTTTTLAGGAADTFNFGLIGINSSVSALGLDGSGAQPAGQLDGTLRIPMTVNGGKNVVLSTDDVSSGDITGPVVQFRILLDDATTGTETEVGILNVVTPE